MRNRKGLLAMVIILLVIIADQTLKIWIKTRFYLGEDYPLTSWFHLRFIENNGMAFGLELWNKYLLTFGRILAVGFFIWYIVKASRIRNLRTGFMVSAAMIAAGAAGNIFDCVFYGVIFNNPMPPEVAAMFPAAGGYASWFEGKVVDMLYFPLFTIDIGGSQWEFFQYIFNIADASICVGVFLLALFYSRDLALSWHTIFPSRKKGNKGGDGNGSTPGNEEKTTASTLSEKR